MKVVRIALKSLGIALLMGVFWAVAWGAAAGGCAACGIRPGVIVGIVGLVLFPALYLWLTGTSKGRLQVATGEVRLRRGRMVLIASVMGVMYGIAGFLPERSVVLAVVAGGTFGLGEFVLVPVMLWQLLKPELKF